MSGAHNLNLLCKTLLVSRSGYYDWLERRNVPGRRATEDAVLKKRIQHEYQKSRRTYGSPRITRALKQSISRKRVARLMREQHLHARQRSKYRVVTTDSRHADPIAPNRLRGLVAEQRDQVWVTDATAILTGQGWLYVVALLDVYTRRIVGWSMQDSLDAALVTRALLMAIAQRKPKAGLIVHSDRGSQFASTLYRQTLSDHHCVASMSRKANCYDNAQMESFWSSLKYEVVYPQRFHTKAEARAAVFDYIETFYNRTRMHSSLGYLSPAQFESSRN